MLGFITWVKSQGKCITISLIGKEANAEFPNVHKEIWATDREASWSCPWWFKLVPNVIATHQKDATGLYFMWVCIERELWGCRCQVAGVAQPTSEGKFEVALFCFSLPMEDSYHLFCCQGCVAICSGKQEGTTHRALIICKTDTVVCKVHVWENTLLGIFSRKTIMS